MKIFEKAWLYKGWYKLKYYCKNQISADGD
jgi:hypothetical protein